MLGSKLVTESRNAWRLTFISSFPMSSISCGKSNLDSFPRLKSTRYIWVDSAPSFLNWSPRFSRISAQILFSVDWSGSTVEQNLSTVWSTCVLTIKNGFFFFDIFWRINSQSSLKTSLVTMKNKSYLISCNLAFASNSFRVQSVDEIPGTS